MNKRKMAVVLPGLLLIFFTIIIWAARDLPGMIDIYGLVSLIIIPVILIICLVWDVVKSLRNKEKE